MAQTRSEFDPNPGCQPAGAWVGLYGTSRRAGLDVAGAPTREGERCRPRRSASRRGPRRAPTCRRSRSATCGCTSPGWARSPTTTSRSSSAARAPTSGTSTASATSTGSRRCSASTPATAAPRSATRWPRQVARARLHHDLELRPPARDRARRADRLARARRPQPGLLHQRRLGGGRVGDQARPRLSPAHRQPAQDQVPEPRRRLPRDHDGGAPGDRDHRAAQRLRAARPRRDQGAEHEQLPLARGPRPALGRRPDRGADRVRGPGDGRRGDPRAAPERRRLHPAAGRLLPARPRDLRPPQRPARSPTR